MRSWRTSWFDYHADLIDQESCQRLIVALVERLAREGRLEAWRQGYLKATETTP